MRGFNRVTWNFTEASHGKGAPETSAELVPPDLKTVPGTMRIHQLTTKAGLIYTREVSCSCDFACGCFSPKEFDFRDNVEPEKENTESVLEASVGEKFNSSH
ncbi:hypothetical protein DPX16_17783 [Anabarilius grahami]|uniref:Uncharacterized protein n=1 Tax=Anabarilius grahami TaxID=495550 RepID=A0A3N0YHP8_ANAGA|nr:hypothetical protein DPX16_17783 [Anabarilius grahami]